MSWLALYSSNGQSRRIGSEALPDELPRGTLVLELDLSVFAQSPTPVLRLSGGTRGDGLFTLQRMSDRRMHLLRFAGTDVCNISVGLGNEPVSGLLRLTYHWDTTCHRSLLTAENLTAGTIRQQEVAAALPVRYEDIYNMFASEHGCQRHPAIGWYGLADHLQPVGPTPGLSGETLIETPDGPRRLKTLRKGDLVMTADNGAQPLLWQGAVAVPSMGAMRMVRLVAPYFGRGSDLMVQATQRLAISGSEVEYLFNEDEVLVEARHMVNGRTALWEPEGPVVACHGLLLATHQLIKADGCWVDSLFMGRIARNPDLARITAPGIVLPAASLPSHDTPVRRELLAFEAQTLTLARDRNHAPFAA